MHLQVALPVAAVACGAVAGRCELGAKSQAASGVEPAGGGEVHHTLHSQEETLEGLRRAYLASAGLGEEDKHTVPCMANNTAFG